MLLAGGGSLKLKTNEFENQQPDSLQVSQQLALVVLDPIPLPPPEPVINNVERINFRNTPASGFKLSNNLPIPYSQTHAANLGLTLLIQQSGIRLRSDSSWQAVPIWIWNGEHWITVTPQVFDGTTWLRAP
jgi:hypothetical protein